VTRGVRLWRRAGGRTGSPYRQPVFHTASSLFQSHTKTTKPDDEQVEAEPSAAARRALAEARALLHERPSFIELLVGVFGACRQMSPDQLRSFCFMALASAPTVPTPAIPATSPTSAARLEAFDDLLNIENEEDEHNSHEGFSARPQYADSPHQPGWASSAADSARYVAEQTTPTMRPRPVTRLEDHRRSDVASDSGSNSGSSDGDDLFMPASVGFKRPRDASAPPSPYTRPPEPAPPSSDGSSPSSEAGGEEEGSSDDDDDDDGSSSHWSSAQEDPPLTPEAGEAVAENIQGVKHTGDGSRFEQPHTNNHNDSHVVAGATEAPQQQRQHDDEWPDVEVSVKHAEIRTASENRCAIHGKNWTRLPTLWLRKCGVQLG
jgi:hypothetical protein